MVPAAAAAWLCAWLASPSPSWPAALALWALAGLAVALAVRRRAFAMLVLAAAAAALVATVVAARPVASAPDRLDSALATVSETVHGSPFEAVVGDAAVLVFWEDEGPPIPLGATIALSGRTAPLNERIRAFVFADEVTPVAEPPPVLAAGDHARAALLTATAHLAGSGGDLLPGLAVGDTSRVGPALDRAMRTASLTHLTAVSGANCAIVVGLVMLLLRRLPLRARIAAALFALAGFVVLVTPQPSVLRAAVMALVVLIALARGRPASGLPVLCLAVLGLLVAEPWLAREYGFALSVLATGGLLVLAPALSRRLETWLPAWLALAIAVPVSAQAACQPVLLMLDASLPAYGVIANLLAGPAAPVATVLGLLLCVLAVTAPPLAGLLAPLAWVPAAWVGAVAEFFAALPLSSLPWPAAPLGVVLLIGIALLLGSRPAAAAALLIVVLAAGAGVRAGTLLDRPADWQFAMCDVGQGDALVARSEGLVMLVDTGPDPDRLTDCLADLGVGTIDLLVLTHYDADHVGGAEAVAGRVQHALVGPPAERDDERLLAMLAIGGTTVRQAQLGDAAVFGTWRWRVLWPAPHAEPGNDASVTLSLEPLQDGTLSALLLGDLGAGAQRAMTAAGRPGPVSMVKVSHHGSADQDPALYHRIHPVIGLIGVGSGNDYGHPTARALGILAGTGSAVRRTDVHGLILIGSSDDGVTIWTERVRAGG